MKSIRSNLWSKYLMLIIGSFLTLLFIKTPLSYIFQPYILLNKYCFKLIDNVFDFVESKDDLINEINSLKQDQKKLLDNISGTQKLESQGIIASVISRDFKINHQMTLNRGTADGVEKGMVAVVDGKLLGKVIEVSRWQCKIAILSDSTVAVVAESFIGKHEGICQGNCNILRAQFNFISSLLTLNVGDPVFTTGEGLSCPRSFLIGYIKSIQKEGVYHSIILRLALDPFKVKECVIL